MDHNENKLPWTYETEQQPQPVNQPVAPQQPEPAQQTPVQPVQEPVQPQQEPAQPSYQEPVKQYQQSYYQHATTQPQYTYTPPVKKKQKKNVGIGAIIAVALCCSLLGGVLGAVGGVLATRQSTPEVPTGDTSNILEGQRENTVIDITKIDTSKLMTPAEVYAANVNSTVGITTSITTNFWGYQTTSAASGSGFIISADGYILTNHHVIEDSNSITVSFYDGSTKDAQLIGYDASNDIAVLKVEATDLTPVVLGDSDNLNVGDTVLAIGNPLGELTFSLTVGAVSALDREVTTSTGVTMDLMQTDCAINSGNSGGALFNLYGEVIGITNAKYSSNGSSSEASIDNIGFAIPLNNIRNIVKSLIEKGYISKPYIGVSVTDVNEQTQIYAAQGAAVQAVVEDSPSAKAGLQVNDIITHVDGKQITGSADLVSVIGDCTVGQVLKLTVYRQGDTIELELTVGEQIQQGIQEESQQQQQQPSSGNGFQGFPFWGFGY